jgi:hypothetical protein
MTQDPLAQSRWPRPLATLALLSLACKQAPPLKPVANYWRDESVKQCLVLGGDFGSPGFSACLVDRFGWPPDSAVRMVEDSARTYEIEMAKVRAALRDSLAAQAARDSVARANEARAERAEQARKQAILDSFEAERARRQLRSTAPKP